MVSSQVAMDFSAWDGTVSSGQFHIAAHAFAERWNKFNTAFPQWSWVRCPKRPWIASSDQGEGYLSLENIVLPKSHEEGLQEGSDVGQECSCSGEEEEFTDDALLVQMHAHGEHRYAFHVIYSASYKVPVLYFRSYYSDGQPLMLEKIEKDISLNSSKELLGSKWTFITQEEHPFLNRPWCTLHPCGTSEWMKLLFTQDDAVPQREVTVNDYLVSWFSVVGQVFGLRVPFEMLGKFVRPE